MWSLFLEMMWVPHKWNKNKCIMFFGGIDVSDVRFFQLPLTSYLRFYICTRRVCVFLALERNASIYETIPAECTAVNHNWNIGLCRHDMTKGCNMQMSPLTKSQNVLLRAVSILSGFRCSRWGFMRAGLDQSGHNPTKHKQFWSEEFRPILTHVTPWFTARQITITICSSIIRYFWVIIYIAFEKSSLDFFFAHTSLALTSQ